MYKKKEIYDRAKKEITERNLFFVDDVVAFLPCDRTTFYRHIPVGSTERKELDKLMERNKVRTKASIRHKLYSMDNPTAQIALYRMLATQEERDAISLTKTDITTGGKPLITDMPIEEIDKEIARLQRLQENEE